MRQIPVPKLTENRKVICYGAGLSLAGLLQSVSLAIEYVVDDTPALQGKRFAGLEIRPSSALHAEDKGRVFVLICAHTPAATIAIARSLSATGFRYGYDYADCAFLHFETMGKRLTEALGIQPNFETFAKCRVLSLHSPCENLSTVGGSWLFVEIVDALCRNAGGDVAEFGVYKGGNAFVSLLASEVLRFKSYHLLDSFCGFPDLSGADPASRRDEFRDSNVHEVRRLFQDFENVHIHEGCFDKTLPKLAHREFQVSYLDCDLYEPTKLCLNFLYDRTPRGGCILFHDYWVPEDASMMAGKPCWAGIRQAISESGVIDPKELIVFPETTHALYLKP